VRSGKPVIVGMEVDHSFGGDGGHFANVIGVQTGADGKLTSVLVATNWAGQPVWEITAASFMDDWMGFNSGEYMTVDRKPPPPPKQPGFSEALLKDLQEEGVNPPNSK
jgi:hypothetical protein